MGIRVDGLNEAARQLSTLAAALPAVGGTAVRAAAATIGAGMERRAPDLSDDYEGSIGRSIATERVSDTEALVGPMHGLSQVVEDGGVIEPRHGSVLKFNGDVYRRSVRMPPQPFVRNTVDSDKGEAGKAAEAASRRAIRRVTG